MLLAIDIGNTNIVVGIIKDDKILHEARIATDRIKTSDQYGVEIKNILIDDIIDKEEFFKIVPLSRVNLPENEIIEAFKVLSLRCSKDKIRQNLEQLQNLISPHIYEQVISLLQNVFKGNKNLWGLIMTKAEFLELLKQYNINENLVVFDDAIKEGYCVRKNYFRWEVFFRERGKEYDCVGFPSESNALQYLFDKLYSLYVK